MLSSISLFLMVHWLMLLKFLACGYAMFVRRHTYCGAYIAASYLVFYVVFFVIMSSNKPTGAYYYLLCAAWDYGHIIILSAFPASLLRLGLMTAFSLCVIVNVATYIEDDTPYIFFYNHWKVFIQILGVSECAAILTLSSSQEEYKKWRKTGKQMMILMMTSSVSYMKRVGSAFQSVWLQKRTKKYNTDAMKNILTID